eukprot:CAMPEP_0184699288 /NCGR_PEP_ID=MMETSP0313-20130426/5615_1 /TAXON_ID=2792 /ORGANISM="Porphyridium aerugineum, Strain SAG 1380-2" /LENGTH=1325 /DNA_ID=CAMNT_0027158357 /DNA_START=115 /DNA_END=4092 /DNA_ORIENTATION=+
MGILAEIDRSAQVSWRGGASSASGTLSSSSSSGKSYLAAATYDTSYSNVGNVLEVFTLDVAHGKLHEVTNVPLESPCHRVAWGAASTIAVGLDDGIVRVWDAAKLCKGVKDDTSVLFGAASSATKKKHQGAVRGLEFNPGMKTLLASGAADGEVLIWDLGADPTKPTIHSPAGSSGGAPGAANKAGATITAASASVDKAMTAEITDLSWNRKVQHILGTVNTHGVSVIWDLKQKKPVISIRDPRGRRRCSSLAWSSDIATQVIIASDDDASGALRLWDLRNATSPIREYTHHGNAGVTDVSWSSFDSDFIVSSCKDASTMVFSATTGEVLAEMPKSPTNWVFNVQWVPTQPGVMSCCSTDGHISIYSLLSATSARSGGVADGEGTSNASNALAASFGVDAADFALPEDSSKPKQQVSSTGNIRDLISKAPKWLAPRCAVAFGFGGRVLKTGYTTNPPKGSAPELEEKVKVQRRQVVIKSIVVESNLTDSFEEVENVFASATPESMSALCSKKMAENGSDPVEKTTWEFLKLQFEENSRVNLVKKLGYTPGNSFGDTSTYGFLQAPPLREVFKTPAEEDMAALPAAPSSVGGVAVPPHQEMKTTADLVDDLAGLAAPWDINDSADGGDSLLDSSNMNAEDQDDHQHQAVNKEVSNQPTHAKAHADKEHSTADLDAQVERAIVVGDFEKAVSLCQAAGKYGEALVLARCGGDHLWSKTMHSFLLEHKHPAYRLILRSIARGQLGSVLEGCHDWKEALALIATYSEGTLFQDQCREVGTHLLNKGDFVGAVATLICSGNTGLCATVWFKDAFTMDRRKGTESKVSPRFAALLSVVLKIRVAAAAASLARGARDFGASNHLRSVEKGSASLILELGFVLASEGGYDIAAHCVESIASDVMCSYGSADELRMFINETRKTVAAAQAAQKAAAAAAASAAYRQSQAHVTGGYGSQPNGMQYGGQMGGPRQAAPQYSQPQPYGGYGGAPPVSTPSVPAGYSVMQPSAPMSSMPPAAGPPPMSSSAGLPAYNSATGYAGPPGPTMRQSIPPVMPSPPPTGFAPPPSFAPPSLNPPMVQTAAIPPPSMNQPYNAPTMPSFSGMPTMVPQPGPPPMQQQQPPAVVGPPPTMMPAMPSMAPSFPTMPAMTSNIPPMTPTTMPSVTPSMVPPVAATDPAQTRASIKPTVTSSGRVLPPSAEVAGIVQAKIEKKEEPKESVVGIDEADVSQVPANQKVIVNSLRDCFNRVNSMNQSPVFKKKMDDVSKKMGRFLVRLNRGEFDENVIAKLMDLSNALNSMNLDAALEVVKRLTADHWDQNSLWILALKRLVESAKTGH